MIVARNKRVRKKKIIRSFGSILKLKPFYCNNPIIIKKVITKYKINSSPFL